ncbi:MAG: hypothetical protein R3B13_34445 [Polyangiaceae bacterium]
MRTFVAFLCLTAPLALASCGSSSDGGGGNTCAAGGSGGEAAGGKIDLLLMVDNSLSMADKQALLISSVDDLVGRFTAPRCVDGKGQPTGQSYPCDPCSVPEFRPVADMHIGVVSSSLGSFGGDLCDPISPSYTAEQNDRAHLLGSVRPGLPQQDGLGFLAWAPGATQDPAQLANELRQHVGAVGEKGCGHEAQLESWYRFLIDPQPPVRVERSSSTVVVPTCAAEGQPCETDGVCVSGFCADKTLLDQRAAFLREDSAVVIVMLTDENDCSRLATGQTWLVSISSPGLPRARAVCNSNPDDACCTSCGAPDVAGCTPASQDPECAKGNYSEPEDNLNLRCWEQKRRFGIDFLAPTSRYIDGLSAQSVEDRSGSPVPNPLFASGKRGSDRVFLAGIVGVPWQLIATDASQSASAPLEYKRASQIDWAKITPTGSQPPSDPHMVESNQPRPLVADWTAPNTDPIHGHDWDITAGFGSQGAGDLQYACTFPLAQPKDCSSTAEACDCWQGAVDGKNPLCWDGSAFTSVQHRAKAYPGLRQLDVMKGIGDQAIVASICPKNPYVAQDPSSGYGPAVDAIVRSVATALP